MRSHRPNAITPRSGSALLAAGCLALTLSGASQIASGQAQLSGTQEELREILFPRPDEVAIDGHAELSAFMDTARVDLVVSLERRSLEDAMRDNQALRLALSREFIAQGIIEESINNAKFSSSPQRGLFTRRPNGYEVSARLQVSVSSEAQLQMLAAAADRHEEVTLGEMSFEHSEAKAFEQQARELALQDALSQAESYARTLGLTLSPKSFHTNSFARRPRFEPGLMRSAAAMEEMAMPASANNFDEVNYEARVTVSFEIARD